MAIARVSGYKREEAEGQSHTGGKTPTSRETLSPRKRRY